MAKLTGTNWDKILMQVMCDGGVWSHRLAKVICFEWCNTSKAGKSYGDPEHELLKEKLILMAK